MSWNRRQFMLVAGIATGTGIGAWVQRRPGRALEPALVRPPGARSEAEFLATCIRCGQCVTACPFDSIKLAVGVQFGVSNGSPYVDTRETPCYLCQGRDRLECIAVCPTSALQPVADDRSIRMGLAAIDESKCLAYNGTVCRSCWHACPFPNEAIRFDNRLRPVVDMSTCIGCGLCDHACPTDPTSIPVRPNVALSTGSRT